MAGKKRRTWREVVGHDGIIAVTFFGLGALAGMLVAVSLIGAACKGAF
jgi:hypothetical protein